jgi:hypothetical protein
MNWLQGLDAPRALPADLRGRLEQQLLGSSQSRPLNTELTQRLTSRLADPVADLLHDLDAPRLLTPELRAALLADLRPSHRHRWIALAATAASIAAALVLAMLITEPSSSPVRQQAGPAPTTFPSATPPPQGTSAPPVAGGSAGQVLVPGSVPFMPGPVPAPMLPPSSSGGSSQAGDSSGEPYGYYQPPGGFQPAAMPPDGGPPPSQAPTPEVTSRSPDAGPLGGGTVVRVNGSRLQTAKQITFGDAVGTDLRVVDDSHLSVTSPPHEAGRVSFVVHFDDGGSYTVNDGFTYLKAPHIDSLSPETGPTAGGSWVLLNGDALSRVTAVRFGDSSAIQVEVVSDTQLRVLTPAHGIGPTDVTATSPGGTSNAVRFVYLP